MALARPSLSEVWSAAERSARRFPAVLLAALVTTIVALVLVQSGSHEHALIRVAAAASLGLPLLFAVASAGEAWQWSVTRRVAVNVAALSVLAVIGLAAQRWTDEGFSLRYGLFSVAFHLLAAFLCFWRRGTPDAFWQYNRVLLLRFLTAALYVVVLFAGLSAALGAIKVLFNAPIEGETFARLWIVDSLAFGTWFFVAGLPEPLSAADAPVDYPDGLRKFTQYVLVPLVVIYLVILTAYLVKVLATQVWPSGWIGYLVSYVTITGILAWLLVRPLEDRAEYAWVKGYTRGFYLALLPSIAMLWMALFKRVSQYGLTERRTIALAGAAWLTGIAAYYVSTRSRNIKAIPVTLCAVVALLSAGPVSAASLSLRDQTQRVERALSRNALLRDGRLVAATRAVPDSDAAAISEGIAYLRDAHGPTATDAWLSDSLRTTLGKLARLDEWMVSSDSATKLIVRSIGVKYRRRPDYVLRRESRPDSSTFQFSSGASEGVSLSGFEYLTDFSRERVLRAPLVIGAGVIMRMAASDTKLEFVRDSVVLASLSVDSILHHAPNFAATTDTSARDTTASNVGGVVVTSVQTGSTMYRQGPVQPPLVVDVDGRGIRVRVLFRYLHATRPGRFWQLHDFNGEVLVGSVPAPEPK